MYLKFTQLAHKCNTAIYRSLIAFSYCYLCSAKLKQQRFICRQCSADLPRLHNCCDICAIPLSENVKHAQICGPCAASPPCFARTFTPFVYYEPINYLISQYKFQQQVYLSAWFAKQIIQCMHKRHAAIPDVVIAVPLHKKRLCYRGYNQSLIIARHIAKHYSCDVVYKNVLRHKETLSQSRLSANHRIHNMRNAFRVGNIRHKNILVIDDVITTGTTIKEFTQAIPNNKNCRINVASIARAE